MKRTVLLIAALIAPSLLCWAAVGFVVWNWNPSVWTEGARLALAVLASSTTLMVCAALLGVILGVKP